MTGIPLILLPGLGSDGALWEAQVRDLADIADCHIGDTLHDDSLPAMARRILAAAPPRFALAGLSMGGYLALEIVRQAPDRVERLALLDTSARPDTPEATAQRDTAIAAIAVYPYRALAEASLARLVAPDASAAVREAVVEMGLRVGADVYVAQQRAVIARPDSRPLLATIAVPTLVLVGDRDVLTPPDLSEEIAAAIPGAKLQIVAGSGHLSALEYPDEVTAALRTWLAA